jgi:hypothetical protein
MIRLRTVSGAVLAVAISGCGLISSDVTNFDLTLPDKNFSVDAASWNVSDQDAMTLLATNCSSNPQICSSAVQAACPMGCTGTCDGGTHTCDVSLAVSLYQGIDLLTEKPELKSINDQPVIKVSIDSVTYAVTANTLNVDTPMVSVYVAPLSALKPGDAQAKLIGTIPPIPAMMTSDFQALRFTPTGKADLINFMSTFKTPFNVLVASSLVVGAGQMLPMGKLDAVVRIRGHAGL